MVFILTKDWDDDDIAGTFERYRDYLESVKTRFPPSAYALATSNWYFLSDDHRCPHDAWLESFHLIEPSSGERHEIRTLSLRVRLLGPYHDGYIELSYPQVFAYRFNVEFGEYGHRDWRFDELRVSAEGRLIHEIEWCGLVDTGRWLIEASDLEFKWVPFSTRN